MDRRLLTMIIVAIVTVMGVVFVSPAGDGSSDFSMGGGVRHLIAKFNG